MQRQIQLSSLHYHSSLLTYAWCRLHFSADRALSRSISTSNPLPVLSCAQSRHHQNWLESAQHVVATVYKLIVGTEGEGRLYAIASLGMLCQAEQAGHGHSHSPHYCCVQAQKEHSFRHFLPAFREAVQVKTCCATLANGWLLNIFVLQSCSCNFCLM